jgi:Tol biopolymer transport system component
VRTETAEVLPIRIGSSGFSQGNASEIARMAAPEGGVGWNLSPDGSLLAVVRFNEHEGRLRFMSLPSGVTRDVVVKDWPQLWSLDWSPDSAGMFAASVTSNWGTPVLLFVEPDGKAQVVWEGEKNAPLIWAIPSPDGRSIALMMSTGENNVWMIENF